MTKLQDKLKDMDVFNNAIFFWENPYIWYRPRDKTRTPAWMVTKRGQDIGNNWYDYGSKSFPCIGNEDKAQRFEEAKSYMAEKFGITRLSRSPFGGWGDADFIAKRIAELTAEKVEK